MFVNKRQNQKKIMLKISITVVTLLFCTVAFSQKNIFNQVNSAIHGSNGKKSLSNDDIVKGLKEALKVGTNNSTASASKLDGYYKNPLIKIPFPKEANSMESQLRSLGMDKEVDKFVETLNRAAEDAAKKAAPIFIDAVTKMTITDGVNILKGNNDAATQYLKNTSSSPLKDAFKPVIQSSLDKVEVTKYWKPLTTAYDKIPFVTKVNPDLNEYVTLKAIDGLFKLIADEELKIRSNPEARVTDILKKVFGK
jgi:hypothetical protein